MRVKTAWVSQVSLTEPGQNGRGQSGQSGRGRRGQSGLEGFENRTGGRALTASSENV